MGTEYVILTLLIAIGIVCLVIMSSEPSSVPKNLKITEDDVSSFLLNHYFKNVTKLSPIYFVDCLPYSFSDIYDVHSRFVRVAKSGIATEILIGLNTFNRVTLDVIIRSAYGECVSKAVEHINVNSGLDWKECLLQLILQNEICVKSSELMRIKRDLK